MSVETPAKKEAKAKSLGSTLEENP